MKKFLSKFIDLIINIGGFTALIALFCMVFSSFFVESLSYTQIKWIKSTFIFPGFGLAFGLTFFKWIFFDDGDSGDDWGYTDIDGGD